MRRVDFDFGNTCPIIDKAIKGAQKEIESFVDELLMEASPLLPDKDRKELASKYALHLYRDIEDYFEMTRKSNEEMRDAADKQISDLKDEIADLEYQLKRLEEA
jgi:polyhydroxyalkanoate synthesis regulator phasin